MIRIFQGKETRQIDGVSGAPVQADGWYWEPDDYEGDVLWSEAFASAQDAQDAADTDTDTDD